MNWHLTLVLGGARSGKSSFAQRLAAQAGERVLYVATAEARDEEMQTRIAAHQRARPTGWRTLEAPLNVGLAVRAAMAEKPVDVVLLDCLTLLVSNRTLEGLSESPSEEDLDKVDQTAAQARVATELDDLLGTVQSGEAPWIVVSNEVGLGLVPPYPLGRISRDLLGWANQRLAAAADRVYLMVAGLPVEIKAL